MIPTAIICAASVGALLWSLIETRRRPDSRPQIDIEKAVRDAPYHLLDPDIFPTFFRGIPK